MVRQCGSCRYCCWMFGVNDIDKPSRTNCKHECSEGCAIHNQSGYPKQCADFVCPYLQGEDIHRPDEFQFVLHELGGTLTSFVPYISTKIPIEKAIQRIKKLRVLPATFKTEYGWIGAVVPLDQQEGQITFSETHWKDWNNEA